MVTSNLVMLICEDPQQPDSELENEVTISIWVNYPLVNVYIAIERSTIL